MTKRKNYHELAADNTALRMALEDVLDIIQHPNRYHHSFMYTPEAAPRDELNPPGMKGAHAIVNRAKQILGKARG